jgi:hypothetical protein
LQRLADYKKEKKAIKQVQKEKKAIKQGLVAKRGCE